MAFGETFTRQTFEPARSDTTLPPPKNSLKLAQHMREQALKTMMTMPVPLIEPPVYWRDEGACIDGDPELFFPEKGHSADAARRICWGCKVIDSCLINSMLFDTDLHGVAGGLSERDRRGLRRKIESIEGIAGVA